MYCTGHRKSTQTSVICMCVLKHVYRVIELQLPLGVFYLFVCLFCCYCFVCVSHDEVSKPRSMQLIDLEVMSSTAEMSVLKCYHNRMQQRRGSIFNHPSRYFQLGLSTLFCFMFYFSVILFSIIPNQITISLPYLSFYLGSIIPPLENNSENLKITFPKVVK